MNLNLSNTTNWWFCVRKYWIKKTMPRIPRHFCLFFKGCQVKLSWNTPNSENTCSLSPPYPLVIDSSMPLVQGLFGYTHILDNWHVIIKYLCRNFYRYSKTSLLIPQVFNHLCGNSRSKKIRYKTWILNCVMAFTVPDYRCIIDKDDYSRIGPPVFHFYCIVSIHIKFDHNILIKCLWHISWHHFPRHQGKNISTHLNISQQLQIHFYPLVKIWGRMISSLCSYPTSYVNTWRCDRPHQGFPLLGNTRVEINNLPLSKYKSFQVQLTTSALQWVGDTCWSVPLSVPQWHIILSWSWISMVYAHIHNSWSLSYLLQVNYQHFQLCSLNYQHICWIIQLVHFKLYLLNISTLLLVRWSKALL